jgi:hypothetical protein
MNMVFSFDCNTSFILIVSYWVMGCQVFEFNKFHFLRFIFKKVGRFIFKKVGGKWGGPASSYPQVYPQPENIPRVVDKVIHRFIHRVVDKVIHRFFHRSFPQACA